MGPRSGQGRVVFAAPRGWKIACTQDRELLCGGEARRSSRGEGYSDFGRLLLEERSREVRIRFPPQECASAYCPISVPTSGLNGQHSAFLVAQIAVFPTATRTKIKHRREAACRVDVIFGDVSAPGVELLLHTSLARRNFDDPPPHNRGASCSTNRGTIRVPCGNASVPRHPPCILIVLLPPSRLVMS